MSIATTALLLAEFRPLLPEPGSPVVLHTGLTARAKRTTGTLTGTVEAVLPWGLLIRTIGGWRTCFSLVDLFAGHVRVDEPGPTRRAVERVRGHLGFAAAALAAPLAPASLPTPTPAAAGPGWPA